MARSKVHSEFGGGPGLIQDSPHDVNDTPHEAARLMRATDPTDPADTVEAALVRERLREGRGAGD